MRALAILYLSDGMVMTGVDDLLLFHLGVGDVVHQCPADTTTRTCIDEAILRTGIEGIFAVDELRMQHHITLLALGSQVRQALPGLQVFRTGDACCRRCSREIARL